MKKNANIPILLVVIALVAIVAQWNRNSSEKTEWPALRQDLFSSLGRLWERPQQEVELLPGYSGVAVRAQVSMPPGLRPRQQRWNYPFLRFVAQRHPAIHIEHLEVVDATNRQKISEIALNGLLAERAYAPREDEESNCVMVSRQLTAGLEAQMGPGEALVLVDALRASSRRNDDGIRYGKMVQERRYQPEEIFRYEVCVVTRSPIPDDKWQNFFASHLNHGETIRKVILP